MPLVGLYEELIHSQCCVTLVKLNLDFQISESNNNTPGDNSTLLFCKVKKQFLSKESGAWFQFSVGKRCLTATERGESMLNIGMQLNRY